jgi:hypothetical protein
MISTVWFNTRILQLALLPAMGQYIWDVLGQRVMEWINWHGGQKRSSCGCGLRLLD